MKLKAIGGKIVGGRGLPHRRADQIVGGQVRPDFLADNIGSLASQHVHLKDILDVAQIDLDVPSAKI